MYYTIQNIDEGQLSNFTGEINKEASGIYTLGEKFMIFDAELDKLLEKVNKVTNEETGLNELNTLEGNVKELEIPEQKIEYDTSENENAVFAVISDYMEQVVGAARVIVKYRDDIIDANQEALTGAGDKMVKRHENSTRCVVMPNRGCSESICDTDEKAMVYGPFKNVFNEEENTDVIFEKTFLEGGIIKSLFEGKSAVIFGFGFSGSGKTYQLAAKGNKMSILAQTINALLAKKRINSEGKQIGNELTYEGIVTEMTLDIKELYPYTDLSKGVNNVEKAKTVKFYGDNNGTTTEKEYFDKFLKGNKWTSGVDVQQYINNIMAINEKIENDRINHMRITPTPNNPESSRSHIFYNFKFTLEGGNKGSFVIVDMAGSENTIEIRRDFLLGAAYNEWDERDVGELDNKVINYYNSSDMNNKKTGMEKIINLNRTLGLLLGGIKKYSYYLKSNKTKEVSYFPIVGKLFKNVIDLTLLVNKKTGEDITKKNISLKNVDEKLLYGMFRLFNDKITNSVQITDFKPEDLNKKGTYQGIELKEKNYETIINKIVNIFGNYFDPHEILGLAPYNDTDYKIKIGSGDQQTTIKEIIDGLILDVLNKKQYFDIDLNKLKGTVKSKGTDDDELTENMFLKTSDDIYYKNPIHIIMAVYIKLIFKLIEDVKKNASNTITDLNERKKKFRVLNKIIIYMFSCVITRYINVVCNQGVGIVTTLEHLKYFFLYNTVNHQMLYKYNKKHNDNDKKNRALTVPEGGIAVSKTFTFGEEGEFQETVENGMFQQYKVLELLTQFATKTPGAKLTTKEWNGVEVEPLISDLTEIKKSGSAGNESSEGSKPSFRIVNLPHPKGNKYIMLTAIRRGEKAHMLSQNPTDESKTNNKKYCVATKATLEFAESITSFPKPCQGIEDKTKLGELKDGVSVCSDPTTKGGGKVSHKNKRNFNISNKRSKLNKKFIQRGGDIDYTEVLAGQIGDIKTLEKFKKYFTSDPDKAIIESDRNDKLLLILKKADSKIEAKPDTTKEEKEKVRRDFVTKLIEKANDGTLFKKLEQEGDDLVSKDAVVSDNNAKFIMRKGSTVKNYFDQVLDKIFQKIEQKGEIGKGLETSTTLTELNYKPSGNLTNLQQLQGLLNHNKLKLQKGGNWISTKVGPDFNKSYFNSSITETNILTEKDKIQLRLDKCQDLEVLYAVKHFEVFEITKPIIYFLDTLAKNIILYAYILSLYGDAEKIGEIKFDKQVVNIKALKPFITQFTKLVDEQKQIQEVIGTITPGLSVVVDVSDKTQEEKKAMDMRKTGGNRKNSKKRRRKLTRKGNKQRNSAKNRYNKVRKVRKNVRKTKRN